MKQSIFKRQDPVSAGIHYMLKNASKSKNVDDYLKEVPADRLEALNRIRELFLSELKRYQETMAYGGPCYFKNNIAETGLKARSILSVYIF